MTAEEIRELEGRLPKPNPFTRWVLREQSRLSPGELINPGKWALSTPSFGWDLIRSYDEEQVPLPDFVSHTALLRGNGYLLQPEPVDINVALAHMLSLPGSEAQSRLLHALMLCDDITPEEIARICGYDVDVIRLHDSLFWNVLDRKQDLSYIRRIYAKSGAGRPWRSDAQDYSGDLLLLAYRSRRVDLLLAAASVSHPSRAKLSPTTLYQEIGNKRLRSALAGLAMRAVSAEDNPSLKAALRILRKRRSETAQGQENLPYITPDEGALSILNALREIGDHSEGSQIYDISIADEFKKLSEKSANEKAVG